MKIKIFTKDGIAERELTQTEVLDMANRGELNAKKEVIRQELLNIIDLQTQMNIIKKYLELV